MPLVRPLDPAFSLERQLQLEAGRVVLVNRRQPDLPELRRLGTDRPLQGAFTHSEFSDPWLAVASSYLFRKVVPPGSWSRSRRCFGRSARLEGTMGDRRLPMSQEADAALKIGARRLDLETGVSTYNIAKALHVIGLAMFLGSILGHVTIGFVPGAKDQAHAMLFGRQAIEIATWSLTIPGLVLLAVTGLFMTVRGGLGFGRRRWLTVHQIIAALILLNAALVLVPVGSDLLDVASKIVEGTASMEDFLARAGRERMFGAANVVLALATIFVAVLKPALGQTRN